MPLIKTEHKDSCYVTIFEINENMAGVQMLIRKKDKIIAVNNTCAKDVINFVIERNMNENGIKCKIHYREVQPIDLEIKLIEEVK